MAIIIITAVRLLAKDPKTEPVDISSKEKTGRVTRPSAESPATSMILVPAVCNFAPAACGLGRCHRIELGRLAEGEHHLCSCGEVAIHTEVRLPSGLAALGSPYTRK